MTSPFKPRTRTNPFVYGYTHVEHCGECRVELQLGDFVTRDKLTPTNRKSRKFYHYDCDDPKAAALWEIAREDARKLNAAGHKREVQTYDFRHQRRRK